MRQSLKFVFPILSSLCLIAAGEKKIQQPTPSENYGHSSGTPRGNAASTGIANEELRESEEGGSEESGRETAETTSSDTNRKTGSMTDAEERRKQRVKKTAADLTPSSSAAQSRPRQGKSDPSLQTPIQKTTPAAPSGSDH